MKPKVAIVRGKFLNQYEMQSYEPLLDAYDMTAYGSLTSFHTQFNFPTVKLLSPLDLPEFPYKMQILNRIFRDAQYLWGLENALHGFDIAHTAETYFHFTKQCLLAKQKGYVKKVIVTVWENIPYNNEGLIGRKEIKQQVMYGADHFVAISQRARNALLLEGVDEKKISVVSPGIDTDIFSPAVDKNKKKNIQILFVGRLVKNKGVYELLYALKTLLLDASIHIPITVTIIGSGPEKHKMQQLSKELGISNILIYKNVSYQAMPQEYRKADIFVAPSKADAYWQEQWGMALMEAQASGLPIVTTMIGSIPENVGDSALLAQPGDVVSLEEAIKQLIVNESMRRKFAVNARKRAVSIHSKRISADNMKKVYENVLKHT